MKLHLPHSALLVRAAARVVIPLGLAGAMAGCAAEPPPQELTLNCGGQRQAFVQQFARAYMSRDGEGNVDVVLVDQAAERHLDAPTIASPGREPPVRQVMHLRVLWNPKRDQKTDHSVASNATVHWYVLGNTPSTASDVLEYAGTAFVAIEDSEPAELTIRNAAVHPVACRGGLCDPVGASTLNGTVKATVNRRKVYQALNAVRSAVAAVRAAKPESASSLAR